MAWELQWGGKLEFLKKLAEQGQRVEALENQPRLKPWLAEYYRAFNALSSSRQVGMGGVGPIPMSEMAAYFEVFEVRDLEERDTYITMIQALDSVYLKHVNKPSDQPKGKSGRRYPSDGN